MDHDQEFVSLSVRPAIRDQVRAMKQGGETYTDVLTRLLAQAETDNQAHNAQQ